jgi:hypothetical protein
MNSLKIWQKPHVLEHHNICTYGYIGCLVYSCFFHFEHRAPVKRFISLQFLNLRHSVGLLVKALCCKPEGRGFKPR